MTERNKWLAQRDKNQPLQMLAGSTEEQISPTQRSQGSTEIKRGTTQGQEDRGIER